MPGGIGIAADGGPDRYVAASSTGEKEAAVGLADMGVGMGVDAGASMGMEAGLFLTAILGKRV
ncbi:hypothetical protein [Acetobacter persici]|uniref:hypothetical protein n=1 Tax=Acetobacter persici TaxID=1076596 RepID=UPI000A397BE1|nr:hypothetical protein [Acetobacter persici]OUI90789.1 hypothetical protein HK19_08865 [Acetobacter persici]